MAYKNCALDHVLKDCMQFCPQLNIVRIGHVSEGYEDLQGLTLRNRAYRKRSFFTQQFDRLYKRWIQLWVFIPICLSDLIYDTRSDAHVSFIKLHSELILPSFQFKSKDGKSGGGKKKQTLLGKLSSIYDTAVADISTGGCSKNTGALRGTETKDQERPTKIPSTS